MIAQDTGAQYIIGGVITDLTATIEQKLLQEDNINRQFALDMTVFDGKTGNEVYNKNYREVARWPFPKTSQVDTKKCTILGINIWRDDAESQPKYHAGPRVGSLMQNNIAGNYCQMG